jgi:rSAM/selenodomain-associated transferase 2
MGKAFAVAGSQGAEMLHSATVTSGTDPIVAGAKARPADRKDAKPIDLSIIIPTLNAGALLGETAHALQEITEVLNVEIIVADGGSSDDTLKRAEVLGLKTLVSPRGRGTQLSHGAREARGRWLLFLHADTTLEPFWSTTVTSFMRNKSNAMKAAHFTLALDDASNAARRVEVLANWRARRLGLPYGDQGLLISRQFYNTLVGYLDIPIMEDVDMVRRIGRRNLVELPATATTSAARYRRDGYWRRPIRNLFILSLYFMGVSPRRLARLYG